MLAMTVATLMALAVMVLFPETGTARFLRRCLIEAPARWLNRTTVWRVLFFAGLIAAGIAMTMLFEAEGLIVYGFMAPEIALWAMMFDVGLLIDAILIAAAVIATNGLKVARLRTQALAGRLVAALRLRTTGRTVRPPAVRRPGRKPADDDRPGWAQPAYRAFSMA